MENWVYEWLAFLALSLLIMSAVGGLLAIIISLAERIIGIIGERTKKAFIFKYSS